MIHATQSQLNQIRTHAEATYPEECCGLLLGTIEQNIKILHDVIPTENSWSDESPTQFASIKASVNPEAGKRYHFAIAPEEMLKIQKEARDKGLSILGIYHSHPEHPAMPSEFDRAIAWSEYSYIIVSLHKGNATDLLSWVLNEQHQFQAEEIVKMPNLRLL